MKERKGPFGVMVGGIVDSVVQTARRRAQDREPRALVYGADGRPRMLDAGEEGRDGLVETAGAADRAGRRGRARGRRRRRGRGRGRRGGGRGRDARRGGGGRSRRDRGRDARVTLLDPELAARAIEHALSRGGDLGEVYAEDRAGFGVALDDGRVERPQSGHGRGVSVRVVVRRLHLLRPRRRASPRPTSCGSPARSPRRSAAASRARSRWRPRSRRTTHEIRDRPEEVDAATKADVLRRCDERARAAGEAIAQVVRLLRRDPPADRGLQLRRRGGVRRPHARAARGPGRRSPERHGGDRPRDARRPRRLGADRRRPRAGRREAARKALTMLDAVDAPDRPDADRRGQRVRRRSAARGGRPRPGGRRDPEARVDLRRPAGRQARRRRRHGLRRRPPPERVGQRRHRRRGHADPAHDDPRGRRADLVPLRPAARPQGRRRVDRQRPPRVVPPPAGPAHDQHLLRARARRARRS